MADESRSDGARSEIVPWEPLSDRERWGASVVGGALCAAGVIAVFVSDNQAGSATLLVIAAAFLLIAIQGTPLIRFGSKDHSVELERRTSQRLAERAKDEADPDRQEALLDLAVAVDPSSDRSEQANAVRFEQVEAARYEARVREALSRVLDEHTGETQVARPGRELLADYIINWQRGEVAVEVKRSSRSVMRRDIERAQGYAASFEMPVLVVTNASLTAEVKNMNAHSLAQVQEGGSWPVEVVTWNGPDDDDVLYRGFLRLKPRSRPRPNLDTDN